MFFIIVGHKWQLIRLVASEQEVQEVIRIGITQNQFFEAGCDLFHH